MASLWMSRQLSPDKHWPPATCRVCWQEGEMETKVDRGIERLHNTSDMEGWMDRLINNQRKTQTKSLTILSSRQSMCFFLFFSFYHLFQNWNSCSTYFNTSFSHISQYSDANIYYILPYGFWFEHWNAPKYLFFVCVCVMCSK